MREKATVILCLDSSADQRSLASCNVTKPSRAAMTVKRTGDILRTLGHALLQPRSLVGRPKVIPCL